jgi:hypothetical protein
MTTTTTANPYRTWLLHCDVCDDRVRLDAANGDACQFFINVWKVEHGDGIGNACHVYLEPGNNPIPEGPPAAKPSPFLLARCTEALSA